LTRAKARRRAAKMDGYHHGDLRQALLTEALVMLRTIDPQALSLRELARRLDVTYGAPHYHFREKDDLFAAIAEAAFGELVARTQQRLTRGEARSAEQRLREFGAVYLEFAVTEPARYRVMFLPQLRDRERFASLHETGGRALTMLEAAFVHAGVSRAQAKMRAVGCWSTLHGFAQLVNEGFLPAPGDDLPALREALVTLATRAN
jgi:AcrR family transcriptional regulator